MCLTFYHVYSEINGTEEQGLNLYQGGKDHKLSIFTGNIRVEICIYFLMSSIAPSLSELY